jgi:membrane protease YdiL (CAAX protease family)
MHSNPLYRPFRFTTMALLFLFMAVFLYASALLGLFGDKQGWDPRLISWLQFTLYMGLPCAIVLAIYGQSPEHVGQYRTKQPYTHYVWTLVLALSSLSIVAFLTHEVESFSSGSTYGLWADELNQARMDTLDKLLDFHGTKAMIIALLTMALTPALLEEFVFRGIILQSLRNTGLSMGLSIFIQALLFAVIHLSPYELPGIFLSGIVMGYLALETGSLLLPTLYHFLFNGITLWAQFELSHPEGLEQELAHPLIALIASLALTFALYKLTRFSSIHE